MTQHRTRAELQASLNAIVKQMQVIQNEIGSSSQPPSMHELDALSELGQRYAEVVKHLQVSLRDV